jgi:hypothetical protein
MTAGSLVPPLIAVLATALIAALKDSVGRVFENRTKRVQFWKTMLEASPLADITEVDLYKQKCRQEMNEATDAIGAVTNKFAGRLSAVLLFGILVVIDAFLIELALDIHKRLQNGQPVSDQFENAFGLVRAAVIVIGWFWGRWALRRWLWAKINQGVLPQNMARQRVVLVLAMLLVAGLFFFYVGYVHYIERYIEESQRLFF